MAFTYVFSLSVLTDEQKFKEKIQEKGLPFHDLSAIDWVKFGKDMGKLFFEDIPTSKKRLFSVDIWPDSLESASKGLLSMRQLALYWSTTSCLLLDGKKDLETILERRKSYMRTTYTRSAPPQDFLFSLSYRDTGDILTLMEHLFRGVYKHFNAGQPVPLNAYAAYLDPKGTLFGDVLSPLSTEQRLSEEMLSLLTNTFDHPFKNDIAVLCGTEDALRNFDIDKYDF